MSLSILIVDDEPLARDRLRSLINDIGDDTIAGEAGTGQQAIDAITTLTPDVILLDIRMPGMDGLEAARHISKLDHPPAIIFTTAYGDHALEAFEAHAIDYLLKPIRKARLADALQRVATFRPQALQPLQEEQPTPRTHLSALVQGNIHLLPVEHILYLQADQKYVSVFFTEGELLIEESLKSLEEEFPAIFIRIHRSTLVAKTAITRLEKDPQQGLCVRLKDVNTLLPISRRLQSRVRKAILT